MRIIYGTFKIIRWFTTFSCIMKQNSNQWDSSHLQHLYFHNFLHHLYNCIEWSYHVHFFTPILDPQLREVCQIIVSTFAYFMSFIGRILIYMKLMILLSNIRNVFIFTKVRLMEHRKSNVHIETINCRSSINYLKFLTISIPTLTF